MSVYAKQFFLIAATVFGCVGVAYGQTQVAVNSVNAPNPLTVGAATALSVAIDGGPGNAADWIALYAAGAPDSQYLSWQYLSGSTSPPSVGLTTATLAVQAPVVSGSYEIRLFANNGFTRLATSGAIFVEAPTGHLAVNGVGAPNPAVVAAGSTATVVVTGGPANRGDWVALYASGAAEGAFLDSRYLNNTTVAPATGSASGTLTFIAPVTPGEYEFRFFVNDGYARLATSGPVSVATSSASISINAMPPPTAVSVGAGTHVTVAISDGPSNVGDWIGLYSAVATDQSPILWRYLNGTTTPPASGMSAAVLDFAVPTSAGSYEFRFSPPTRSIGSQPARP